MFLSLPAFQDGCVLSTVFFPQPSKPHLQANSSVPIDDSQLHHLLLIYCLLKGSLLSPCSHPNIVESLARCFLVIHVTQFLAGLHGSFPSTLYKFSTSLSLALTHAIPEQWSLVKKRLQRSLCYSMPCFSLNSRTATHFSLKGSISCLSSHTGFLSPSPLSVCRYLGSKM